ncbi:MAG: ABC transporter ATP-binding protein [Actinomycetota bacterium]
MGRGDGGGAAGSVTALVELQGIVKRFPGIVANDHADLVIEAGRVHSLLGENGAGKTTLMSVLAGIYRPDEGRVLIDGRAVTFRSPRHAIDAGVGMVHQHFRLVAPFTVAENVLLGAGGSFRLSHGEVERRVAQLAADYGMQVDPSTRIWQLSVGEQQRVEILKALFRDARVLILDEPTAVLTPQEADRLFETLRRMAAEGRAIVFISHKLDEVMAVSDDISVLRGGQRVATIARSDATKQSLAKLMVGRDVVFRVARADDDAPLDRAPCLRVAELEALSDLGLPALQRVDLELRRGEILGIAGVAGNGQRELSEAIAGIRPTGGGSIEMGGEDITGSSIAARIRAGLAYIPEDRLGTGIVGSMDCTANVILKKVAGGVFARGPLLNTRAAASVTRRLVEDFDVKTSDLDAPVSLMSGGNIQKLLLGRELSSGPRVLIAAQPTAGLDVGATEAIHKILLEQRSKGVGIFLVSEDLDELLALSDRIAVMYEGRIMGIVEARAKPSDDARERLGLMMAGTSVPAETTA